MCCRLIVETVYDKAIELWDLFDTYNPKLVMSTEKWLKDISNAEAFSLGFTTFRSDRSARGGRVFISVKINHCLCGFMCR